MIRDQILRKAEKLYHPFLSSFVRKEDFFPRTIQFTKVDPSIRSFEEIREAVKNLREIEKSAGRHGLAIRFESRNTARYGLQSLPVEISIEDQADFLFLINRVKEFGSFSKVISDIRSTIPELDVWIESPASVRKILDNLEIWGELLCVCRFIIDHDVSRYYLRELPISVHTKFIEENSSVLRELLDHCLPEARINRSQTDFERRFGLKFERPMVRVRFLDPALKARLGIQLSDFTCYGSELEEALHRVDKAQIRFLVTENKMNFLALPDCKDTIALFGSGCMIESVSSFSFIKGSRIYYWGDLDIQGIEILCRLRSLYPEVHSFLMSLEVLERLSGHIGPGVPSKLAVPPPMTDDELELYLQLKTYNQRLEQEKIPFSDVLQAVAALGPLSSK